MDLVLDDLGANRRDLGDLMTAWLGVVALKVRTTPGTGIGLAGDGVVELFGWDQGSSGSFVSLADRPASCPMGFWAADA